MNGPCLYCEDRDLGCHSSCDKYLAFKEKLRMAKKRKLEEDNFTNYLVNAIAKMKG